MAERTVRELGDALVVAIDTAERDGQLPRAIALNALLKRLCDVITQLTAEMRRVGLNLTPDATTSSGLRAWHSMADDHDSPKAWRATAKAFRRLGRIQSEIEAALQTSADGSGR